MKGDCTTRGVLSIQSLGSRVRVHLTQSAVAPACTLYCRSRIGPDEASGRASPAHCFEFFHKEPAESTRIFLCRKKEFNALPRRASNHRSFCCDGGGSARDSKEFSAYPFVEYSCTELLCYSVPNNEIPFFQLWSSRGGATVFEQKAQDYNSMAKAPSDLLTVLQRQPHKTIARPCHSLGSDIKSSPTRLTAVTYDSGHVNFYIEFFFWSMFYKRGSAMNWNICLSWNPRQEMQKYARRIIVLSTWF